MGHTDLIVFDLDDTLLDTSDVYWSARTSFVEEMDMLGYPRELVVHLFEEIDADLMRTLAHAPHRYSQTMEAAYRQIAAHLGVPLSEDVEERIGEYGRIVMERMPVTLEGARELLTWASGKYDLALVTRGEPDLQRRKLTTAGMERFFEVVRVVDRKDAALFRSVIAELGHSPSSTWVIGDSLSSDIAPGLEIGARCILYEYWHPSYEWRQRHEVRVDGGFVRVTSLSDIPAVLQGEITVAA